MKGAKLYVDESGNANLNHHDHNFTLCGILVKENQSEIIKIRADQIKFKYWGNTEVVFHSKDIGNKTNDFSILNDPNINAAFTKDLLDFLNTTGYNVFIVSINKIAAAKRGWNSAQILDTANTTLVEMFIEYLSSHGMRGQIILESSSTTDIAFYKKYVAYLSHGLSRIDMTGEDVKKILTALSFVSKKNHDIEAQLADLYAYPATCRFLHEEGLKLLVPGSYEEKITNIMSAKTAKIGIETSVTRLPK